MAFIRFKGKKQMISAQVIPTEPSVVRIVTADKPTLTGFHLYLDAAGKHPLDNGEYADHTTLYRQGDGWYELSNDGSVYQPEPTEIEEELPEELSEEQKREQERQGRIADLNDQIMALKAQIEATDYQVIKNYEYALVGLDPEYDIYALHEERQGLRERINQLQSCIEELLQVPVVVDQAAEPVE